MLNMSYAMMNDIVFYSVAENLTLEFNVGFMLGVSFITQIITGFFLATAFLADSEYAYDTIQFMTSNMTSCWVISFMHVNGASVIFILLYMHLFKAIGNASFSFGREFTWTTGFLMLLLTFLVGFTGYSLVWGQMSYWALTVITNLATSIPLVGFDLLEWIWGNSIVNTFTLSRFFCIHFLVPFIILGLILIHLLMFHSNISSTFIDVNLLYSDKVYFTVFLLKDLTTINILMYVWLLLVYSTSVKAFMHPENFLYAMMFVTPAFIEPEWYFLPFYAVLSSIPHKLIGTISLVLCIVLFFTIIMVDAFGFSSHFSIKVMLYWIVGTLMSLGVLAVKGVAYPGNAWSFLMSAWFVLLLLT